MVREYVGARYVPKFMGTYDATQIYEALCVVDNGLGTSYISKIPTLAGTPLTDTDHWAIYGATSGAIINLQNQIDNIENVELPAITSDIQSLDGRVDDLEEWEDVMGAIRKNSITGDWEMISDATHVPQHIASVEIEPNNNMIQINFDKTYSEIGSGYVNCDETYAIEGFSAGISISSGFARVYMARTRPLSGVISISGYSASLLSGYQGDLKTVTYDSTNNYFEITFQDYALANANLSFDVRALGNNSSLVSLDWNVSFAGNNKVRVFPTTDLTGLSGNLMVTLNKEGKCDVTNMPAETNTNLWIHCKMKV